jgi:O-antigen/teichoic acid export membrane protein
MNVERNRTPTAREAMVYSFGQRYIAFAIQLGTSIVLARLLSPEETGIFSLAASAIALGTILREFGTTDYVVSQENLTPEKLRAAYTVTITVAWTAAGVLFIASYPLAHLYKEPGVATVMHVLCLNFLLVPLGSAAVALLTKELRFDTLFWIQTCSGIVAATVTLLCAMNGSSYVSPAWGSVAGIATTVAMLFVRRPSSVVMMPSLHNLRQVFRFGGALTAARIADGLASRSADFIVSGMISFHASGVLSKANSLNAGFYDFFASAVVRVATPVLAQARHANRSVVDGYGYAIILMASVQWLFFGVMVVTAPELVHVLFGQRWNEAAPILQIGAVTGVLYAPYMLCTPLLTARGEASALLRINLLYGVALGATLAIGSQHSLSLAAALSVLAHIFRMYLLSNATRQLCSISSIRVIRGLGPSAHICALAAAIAYAAKLGLKSLGCAPWFLLLATIAISALAFLVGAVLTKHPILVEMKRAWSYVVEKK